MAILIIKNIEFEGPGLIKDVLEEGGIDYDIINADRKAGYPDTNSYNSFIVLGGPQSANDNTETINKEVQFIKEVVNSKKPYIGICLGAQLLAKALGADVKLNKIKELGNCSIRLTENGRKDNLFRGLADKLNVFQWHGETFDIPKGAVKLAKGTYCLNQAFRYGNCYGLQFHLEITEEMVKEWLHIPEYKNELKEQGIDVFSFVEAFTKNYPGYKDNCRILINNLLRWKQQ